jgi:hypothetical protein
VACAAFLRGVIERRRHVPGLASWREDALERVLGDGGRWAADVADRSPLRHDRAERRSAALRSGGCAGCGPQLRECDHTGRTTKMRDRIPPICRRRRAWTECLSRKAMSYRDTSRCVARACPLALGGLRVARLRRQNQYAASGECRRWPVRQLAPAVRLGEAGGPSRPALEDARVKAPRTRPPGTRACLVVSHDQREQTRRGRQSPVCALPWVRRSNGRFRTRDARAHGGDRDPRSCRLSVEGDEPTRRSPPLPQELVASHPVYPRCDMSRREARLHPVESRATFCRSAAPRARRLPCGDG